MKKLLPILFSGLVIALPINANTVAPKPVETVTPGVVTPKHDKEHVVPKDDAAVPKLVAVEDAVVVPHHDATVPVPNKDTTVAPSKDGAVVVPDKDGVHSDGEFHGDSCK